MACPTLQFIDIKEVSHANNSQHGLYKLYAKGANSYHL